MKTRLLKIIGIIAVIVFISAVSSIDYFETGERHQYKFWQEELEFENGHWFTRVLFSYSDDYGKTFSEPVDMSMTQENAHEPKMIVMNGDVILVWRAEQPEYADQENILFAKSTDFGKTFETKPLFFGARPDIKYYDDTIYLTWSGNDLKEIWYSFSNDVGETFSKPVMLFKIDWELSPYEPRPTPLLDVDKDSVTVSWKMKNHEDGGHTWINWNSTDDGKNGIFEIVTFVTNDNLS